MKSDVRRLYALLTPAQRKAAALLLGLMAVGMVLETLGIGLVVPATAVLINSNLAATHPVLQHMLNALGNPTQSQLMIGGMIVLVAAYALKTVFLGYLAWEQNGFVFEVQAELSQRLLGAYLRQPYTFHLQRNSAELISNATKEMEHLTAYCLNSVLVMVTDGLVIFGVACLLLVVEPVAAIIVAVTLGAAGWGIGQIPRSHVSRWGVARQIHDARRIQHLQQGLSGVKEILLLGREAEFLRKFRVHNWESSALLRRQATLQQLPRLALELLAVTALAILVLTMLAQGRDVSTIAPALGLFAAAAFRLIPSANRILMAVHAFRYGRPSIGTLTEELALPVFVPEAAVRNIKPFNHDLRLSGVSYTYPSGRDTVLHDVSLAVNRGEFVGFIGTSGSGKSTLVDVCLGLLAPSSGEILVDGHSVFRDLRAWQDQVGYVPQSVYLIDDSLRRNIAFGLPDDVIDEAAVLHAIRDAQLDEFVSTLPNGLDTMVGERGIALSGGQRQRVGIARALYHDPGVLVLDEATSALDGDTESEVLKAVMALRGTKTILIVAHRLSTVTQCDRLFRLEAGRITSEGVPAVMLRDRSSARAQA